MLSPIMCVVTGIDYLATPSRHAHGWFKFCTIIYIALRLQLYNMIAYNNVQNLNHCFREQHRSMTIYSHGTVLLTETMVQILHNYLN